MGAVQRYLENEKNFISFKAGNPSNYLENLPKLDDFSEKVITLAQENGYVLHSKYGDNPRVFIFGMTHTDGWIDQEEHLEKLLPKIMNPDDLLMHEGRGPVEASYPNYHKEDLIGKLKRYFIDNDIRTIFNDDKMKIGEFMVASNRLKLAKEKHNNDYSNPIVEEAVEVYIKSFDNRDLNFCQHETAGIIPLIKGNSKNYKELNCSNKIFQVIGLLHIYNRVIQDCLEAEDVPYLVFVPSKNEN